MTRPPGPIAIEQLYGAGVYDGEIEPWLQRVQLAAEAGLADVPVLRRTSIEGDVEAVAVVGGMIAAPKKKFGLTITKNCQAMAGTLMESEPKGKVQLLRPLQIHDPKLAGKMTLVKGWMLIPKKELPNQM